MAYEDRGGRPVSRVQFREQEFRRFERYPTNGERFVRRDDRSLGDLFGDLTRETQTLVRHEIELARMEITKNSKKAGKATAFIGLAGALAYAGLIVLMLAISYLLALIMPLWLASAIVGAVVVITGYVLYKKGMDMFKHTDFSLSRTQETMKENKQWMKEEMR